MKSLTRILCCLFVLLTMASCGSGKTIVLQNETITEKIETVHDTIFRIEKDSSAIAALLECQNGKVVIKKIVESTPGRKLKIPKVSLSDNVLKVDCEAEAEELFAQWKSTYIREVRKEQTPPIEVNKLTFWQELQIYLCWIYVCITILLAAWVFIKSKI